MAAVMCKQIYRRLALVPLLAASLGTACVMDAAAVSSKTQGEKPGILHVQCTDDRITVKATSIPRQNLVENIAKTCRLRIYSSQRELMHLPVSVEFKDFDVVDAVDELLRGCNYLIIHNEPLENSGLISMLVQPQSLENANVLTEPPPEEVTEPQSEAEDHPSLTQNRAERRTAALQKQIAFLKKRIANGSSDRARAIALRDKPVESVRDDREVLARLEEKLAQLNQ